MKRDINAKRSINKKGMYEIISTFVVITIIVAAVLGFFAFYTLIYKVQGGSSQKTDQLSTAELFFYHLTELHFKTALDIKKLDSTDSSVACTSYSGVKGYKIVQDAHFGCVMRNWTCFNTPPQSSRALYQINIQQEDSTNCLAKIYIYT